MPPEPVPPDPPFDGAPRPSRSLAAAALTIEAVVTLLAVPYLAVSDRAYAGVAAALVGVLAFALVLAAGLLRRRYGVGLAWLLQALLVTTGVLATPMFVLAPTFAVLFGVGLRLQSRPAGQRLRRR